MLKQNRLLFLNACFLTRVASAHVVHECVPARPPFRAEQEHLDRRDMDMHVR